MKWKPDPHVWNTGVRTSCVNAFVEQQLRIACVGLSKKDLWTLEYALKKYDAEADMHDPFECKRELESALAEVCLVIVLIVP